MNSVSRFFAKVLAFEFVLFFTLIAIAAVKGFFTALFNGGSFMDAITVGAFGFSMIPVFIVTFCFFFMAFLPNIMKAGFMAFFMPIPIYIVAFCSIPLAGEIPKPEFTSMTRVEQISEVEKSVIAVIEGSRRNPTGPEARLKFDWEYANDGRPYESQLEEYKRERNEAIANQKKMEEESSFAYNALVKFIR